MRYLKEYNSYSDIDDQLVEKVSELNAICKKWGIKNYTINDDGTIDVDGNVNISDFHLNVLPLRFGNIKGFFACDTNRLSSFKGCPKKIGGNFYCYINKITDIYDIPEVTGEIHIDNNPVYSLIRYFIGRKDKQEWIELFNELDIIQDGYNVIFDRLKYFYEGTKLNRNVNNQMLDDIKKAGYKIII